MKTKTKVLILSLCASVLIVSTAFVTMAFLTSKDSVKNTFTVGKVAITMDEEDVDNSRAGIPSCAPYNGRDKANKYHLIPGKSYTKDPTIHVDCKSEDCYLFVKVENGLANAEASGDTSIAKQMSANGWLAVDGFKNVYCYSKNGNPAVVTKGENKLVFGSFKLADNADVSKLGNAEIVVTAYAVQAEGFSNKTAAEIWDINFD